MFNRSKVNKDMGGAKRIRIDPPSEAHLHMDVHPVVLALGNCLADEAPARPATVRAALSELVDMGKGLERAPFAQALVRGRYGTEWRDEVRKAFAKPDSSWESTRNALLQYVWWTTIESEDEEGFARAAVKFVEMLESPEQFTRCEGARALTRLCFEIQPSRPASYRAACAGPIIRGIPALTTMVFRDDTKDQGYGCFALVWVGACRFWVPTARPDVLGRLFNLWKHSKDREVQRGAAWALASLPLARRNTKGLCADIARDDFELLKQLREDEKWWRLNEETASLVLAWYLHALSDKEILRQAREISNRARVDLHDPPIGWTLSQLVKRSAARSRRVR